MAVGIETINRLEQTVVNGPDDIDAVTFHAFLGCQQRRHVRYVEGDVLDPFRRVGVLALLGRIRQFEKRQIAAGPNLEKDMHVGIGLLGRRYLIL